jgi:hypothetical protein
MVRRGLEDGEMLGLVRVVGFFLGVVFERDCAWEVGVGGKGELGWAGFRNG